MNLKELTARRVELLDEKAANTQRLAELNAILKSTHPRDRGSVDNIRQLDERAEIISDNADIDAELQKVNAEIRAASGCDNPRDMGYIVTMVAAYIASGSTLKTAELVAAAKVELDAIRETLAETAP